MKYDVPTITVGELKQQLDLFTDDWEVAFSGGLTFHRLKVRGEKLVNVEFNENVYRDSNGEWQVEGD